MFKHTWPFPDYEGITRKFSNLSINKAVYNAAKDFYLGSLEAEDNRLNEFIRAKDKADEEREFIDSLIINAIHVGIGHMNGGK